MKTVKINQIRKKIMKIVWTRIEWGTSTEIVKDRPTERKRASEEAQQTGKLTTCAVLWIFWFFFLIFLIFFLIFEKSVVWSACPQQSLLRLDPTVFVIFSSDLIGFLFLDRLWRHQSERTLMAGVDKHRRWPAGRTTVRTQSTQSHPRASWEYMRPAGQAWAAWNWGSSGPRAQKKKVCLPLAYGMASFWIKF